MLLDLGGSLDDISELILKAEFIVCDLTLERPNVYYELGYAHGAGNRLVGHHANCKGTNYTTFRPLPLCGSVTTRTPHILKRLLNRT